MKIEDLTIIFDGETVQFKAKHLKEEVFLYFQKKYKIRNTPYAERRQSNDDFYWLYYMYQERTAILTREGELPTLEEIFHYLLQWYVQDKSEK